MGREQVYTKKSLENERNTDGQLNKKVRRDIEQKSYSGLGFENVPYEEMETVGGL